ncbi:Rrf2 family transcriptional regulator [bacterium]|nr:Rrf2 family transcriptional regulator [bacterium]
MSLRLSTKGLYSIRAVSRLANQYGKGPVSIRTIAREEYIPLHYLEQLMSRLRRKGFLKSVRGPGGGYLLTRSPDQISIGDIIQTLEGKVTIAHCVDEDQQTRCGLEKTCISRDFWSALSQRVQCILDSVSLQELIEGKWKQKNLMMNKREIK